MSVAGVDDERLRFLVAADTPWLDDLGSSDQVNVGVVASGRNDWVSVSGRASSRVVPAEIEELWSPAASAYFDGPDDPRIAVLELAAEAGEFWDGAGGRTHRPRHRARPGQAGPPVRRQPRTRRDLNANRPGHGPRSQPALAGEQDVERDEPATASAVDAMTPHVSDSPGYGTFMP